MPGETSVVAPSLAREIASLGDRNAKLAAALRELLTACIAEFGDGDHAPNEPDESSVFAGVPDGVGITFGVLRRARAALEDGEAK